jgi:mannose/fructose/N-acetylgalactosamine-specific phosphotransferase system component IIB
VGNYGRADGNTAEKEKITDNLFLTEKDKADFKEIFETGVEVEYQIVPEQLKKKMKELIK